MAAFTASQASVTNGSKVVTINSGESTANIRQGDFLVLGTFSPVEILRGYVSTGGVQSLELIKAWDSGNQSNQKAIVIPTTVEVRAAVTALQNANTLVNDNFAAMQDWQTKTGTVTFTNQDGTTSTIKTLKQMENEANAQLAEYHPYPWAMRKVEFEARRAANNEKFAASGFVHFGNISSSTVVSGVNLGLQVSEDRISGLAGGLALGFVGEGQIGNSKKSWSVINIAGIISNLIQETKSDRHYALHVKLPPTEDGTRTYDRATGVSVTHATPAIAFASETTTNKVVTDRVDMWGFEAFLREINDADPFVYANGLIQSLATNINGVTTVTDNVRPDTYFAWYEGDTTSTGKGVNWQTAAEAQRTAIASDPENNIYFDDAAGKFYQWCVRGRSFAGAGNGDWGYIDVQTTATLRFDIKRALSSEDGGYFSGALNLKYTHGHIGFYHKTQGSFSQIDHGILVCGTVNRLNRGAYHPQLNSSGAGRFVRVASPAVGGNYWSDKTLIPSITGRADLFTKEVNGGALSNKDFGIISNGASGRPDGRYYDAIYASGQGGVCRDMRYSAWGLTQEDFAEADLAVKSGEYRGRELLKKVEVFYSGNITATGTSGSYPKLNYLTNGIYDQGYELADGDYYLVVNKETSEVWDSSGYDLYQTTALRRNLYYPQSWGSSVELHIVYNSKSGCSIADEYTHTEVIGSPANILQCDDLKDGWVGVWNPEVPDGVKTLFHLTRKYTGVGGDVTRSSTVDGGVTWDTNRTVSITDSISNTISYVPAQPANQVNIYQYPTYASKTMDSTNAVVRDLGDVFVSSYNTLDSGCQLGYSLIGKILTGLGGTPYIASLPLTQNNLQAGGKLPTSQSWSMISHNEISIPKPSNSDLAFKALNYNVVENQQGFINYAYTELKHNGTDWGDDGKIHIVDNQTTMLDENGNTNLVGTAQCVEPLGWIKNDK